MRATGPVHQPWWCIALLLCASSDAWGQVESGTAPVSVRLQATSAASSSTCVRPKVVSQRTEANLRRAVFTSDTTPSDVTLQLDVGTEEPPSASLSLSETATGANLGQRRLQTTTCAELQASVVLALTLMLDFRRQEMAARKNAAAVSETVESTGPRAEPTPSEQGPNTQAPATAPDTTNTEAPSDPAPTQDDSAPAQGDVAPRDANRTSDAGDDHLSWDGSLEGRSAWGWAPSTQLGLGVSVGASWQQFRTELGLTLWQPQSVARLGGELALTRRSAHVSLSPWALRKGPWVLRVSAIGALEQTHSEGSGFTSNRNASTLSGNVGVGGSVDYSLSRVLFARLGAAVTAPVAGADFFVARAEASETAFSVAPVSAALVLGVGLKSP